MKIRFLLLSATALLVTGILTSCQSPETKVEAAEEKVQDAKDDLNDVKKEAKQDAIKVANEEEWSAFKSETERNIKNNETYIADLKKRMRKSGKSMDSAYDKKISEWEQRNKDLELKMNNYQNTKSDWESFKREFNHDMDELGKALKNITVDNKK
jgi:vacuolar-type H+-ATPase subunit H